MVVAFLAENLLDTHSEQRMYRTLFGVDTGRITGGMFQVPSVFSRLEQQFPASLTCTSADSEMFVVPQFFRRNMQSYYGLCVVFYFNSAACVMYTEK
mmetsp:Transcript_6095/g.11654  ORF Transcript_6095/g.11654 Transcript_6095/m.11654 type:complete len:97 (-) Transcript_6095:356-646(-)